MPAIDAVVIRWPSPRSTHLGTRARDACTWAMHVDLPLQVPRGIRRLEDPRRW